MTEFEFSIRKTYIISRIEDHLQKTNAETKCPLKLKNRKDKAACSVNCAFIEKCKYGKGKPLQEGETETGTECPITEKECSAACALFMDEHCGLFAFLCE